MPIREYRCKSCDTVFEELILRARDADKVECPKCCGRQVLPLLSVFGVAGAEKKVSSCGSCSRGSCSTCKS